ncbi:MAG: haloalkane dehalogenase [Pseudomonadota bacterium]
MTNLRTPDDRFEDLPGFPFAPNYIDTLPGYESMRVHYLDEGSGDETYLCLHGQPTWSYLYRHMIPVFTAAGGRVVCPDWFGFGKSDKPDADETYTFHFHRTMMLRFIEALDLKNITLVVQDWGGVLGLTIPQEMPERFSRLIIMNTAIATGVKPSDGFLAWKAFAASQPDMDVAGLMQRAVPTLSEAEAAAYAAPYPDVTYKAGVRRFPEMVMIEPGMEGVEESKAAIRFWKEDWQGESFMAVGVQDPVLGPEVMERMRGVIRGCPEPLMLQQAGHFVQESGKEVAEAALASFGS